MIRFGYRFALELSVAALLLNVYVTQVNPNERVYASDAAAARPTTFMAVPNTPDINDIYNQVNKARISAGLLPLERNAQLTTLAQARAADMREHGYYAHKNSVGVYFDDQARAMNFSFSYGCENLNLDFTLETAPYMYGWLTSKAGHRECMLNPTVTEAGYAVAEIKPMSGEQAHTYVVVAIHSTDTILFQK